MSDGKNPTAIVLTALGVAAVLIGLLVSLVGGQSEVAQGVEFGANDFLNALCIIGMGISIQLLGIGLIIIGKR